MTKDQIKKIYEEHKKEYLTSKTQDPFLEGLQIISRLSTNHGYDAEHDIFYASSLDDMNGLTEDMVIELNRLGWHLDENVERFAKHV